VDIDEGHTIIGFGSIYCCLLFAGPQVDLGTSDSFIILLLLFGLKVPLGTSLYWSKSIYRDSFTVYYYSFL